MKTGPVPWLACSCIAIFGQVPTALADSAAATCEVRNRGETQRDTTGACTFSQRQGYINLDLTNGDSYRLTPASQQGRYRDQNGNEVVRTLSGGAAEAFKWKDGREIVLTYAGSSGTGDSSVSGGGGDATPQAGPGGAPDSFDTICGVIVSGKNYRYRCGATDFYSGGQKVGTELRYPDQTIQLKWRPGNRVRLQFEGMVPAEARYSTTEGETNFVFEDKTYFYYSDKSLARSEWQNFRE